MSLCFKYSESWYGFIFVVHAVIELMVQCLCFFIVSVCDDKNYRNFSVKSTFFSTNVYPCYVLVLSRIQLNSFKSLFLKYLSSIWYRSVFLLCLVN